MAEAIANCYVLQRIAIYSWQMQLAKNNRKLYIYRISQLAGRYPRRPSQPSPEPTWGVPARRQPQTAARGDRLLFAGAPATTPYFNIGHKKRMHLAPFSTFYSICLESVTFKTGQQLQCYSTYTISLQLLPILYQLYCYPFIPIAICCAFVPIELIPRLCHIAILLACNTISTPLQFAICSYQLRYCCTR